MKTCCNCKNEFKQYKIINGKRRNLGSRKYCLNCSPWGCHNTKSFEQKEKVHNKFCLNCNMELEIKNHHKKKYCNVACHKEHQYKEYIKRWLQDKEGGRSGDSVSSYIRRYLMDLHSNKCELCGWSQINPFTQKTPLSIHHIDGNWKNNVPGNLQVLCPSCHSLTEFFGSKNTGNGRPFRKKWRENKARI
jgi:hypothetical protein